MRKEAFTRDKSHFTVMLTSPERNVILVNALREAAKSARLNLRIVACDEHPRTSPAALLSDAAYELPPRSHAAYLKSIIDVCVVHRVDLVLPLAKGDVTLLSRNRSSFDAIGVTLAVSGEPLISAAQRWSRNARKSKSQVDRSALKRGSADLEGRFRVVLYFDRAGRLQTVIPCERLHEQGVEHLVTRREPRVIARVRSKLGPINGGWSIVTLDAVMDLDGELIIEDVRLDLGDTIEIAHKAGAQLVRWLLQEHAGLVAEPNDDWREGVEMLRYSAAIYLLPPADQHEPKPVLE
jgi:carbamoyl-phosphate synthase large subunit